MDFEQKYKEALERARALRQEAIDKEYVIDYVKDYETIFPELAESEDERIRMAIIEHFKQSEQIYPGLTFGGYYYADVRAWLEKQKEQKPVQVIELTPIFRIGDILKRKGKDYTFRVDRIQGGYYHCDRNHGAFFPIEEQGNWELVEQKPDNNISISPERLKELRDKSFEDGRKAGVAEMAKSMPMPEDTVLFLKGVKEGRRLERQDMWKPSEEQMKALQNAVALTACDKELARLYNQLQKLGVKEEPEYYQHFDPDC